MLVPMVRSGISVVCVIRSSVRVVASVLGRMGILRSMFKILRGMVVVAVLCRMNRVLVGLASMVFGCVRRSMVIVCVTCIVISVPGIVGV